MVVGLLRVWDEFLCWVFTFSFLIYCVGFWVFTVVMGYRERERKKKLERHKYILLCKYIILMYCIRKLKLECWMYYKIVWYN